MSSSSLKVTRLSMIPLLSGQLAAAVYNNHNAAHRMTPTEIPSMQIVPRWMWIKVPYPTTTRLCPKQPLIGMQRVKTRTTMTITLTTTPVRSLGPRAVACIAVQHPIPPMPVRGLDLPGRPKAKAKARNVTRLLRYEPSHVHWPFTAA